MKINKKKPGFLWSKFSGIPFSKIPCVQNSLLFKAKLTSLKQPNTLNWPWFFIFWQLKPVSFPKDITISGHEVNTPCYAFCTISLRQKVTLCGVQNVLLLLMVLFVCLFISFFCTEPNKNYVILLIAINSKGNGPDVQTKLQTLSGIGKSFKGNFNKTFNLFSNLFKTYLWPGQKDRPTVSYSFLQPQCTHTIFIYLQSFIRQFLKSWIREIFFLTSGFFFN